MASVVSGGVSPEICSSLTTLCRDVVCGDKGVLAVDESHRGISFLFDTIGLSNEEEFRRLYRQLVFWTEDLESCFTSAFITEEAFFQSDDEAEVFPDLLMKKGMLVGVRMDRGPGGVGLDGLRERVESFKDRGASMVRWRGVFRPEEDPRGTARQLARFAAVSQSLGLLPLLAVDLSSHTTLRSAARHLQLSLAALLQACHCLHLWLPGLALSVPFLRGDDDSPEASAAATLSALSSALPLAIGGVLFTSAGFSEEAATCALNTLVSLKGRTHPWKLGFAFSRAQQMSTVKRWEGKLTKVREGQEELLSRARANCAALSALYIPGSVQGSAAHQQTDIPQYYF